VPALPIARFATQFTDHALQLAEHPLQAFKSGGCGEMLWPKIRIQARRASEESTSTTEKTQTSLARRASMRSNYRPIFRRPEIRGRRNQDELRLESVKSARLCSKMLN
jgi:hypothetical protein